MRLFHGNFFVLKTLASLVATFFLYQQIAYAADLAELIAQKHDLDQKANFAPSYLIERSKLTENTVNLKQIIENAPGASTTTDTVKLSLQGPKTGQDTALIEAQVSANKATHYPSGRIESVTLAKPDASGNIYYHYIDEDFNNQGRGRIDKTRRKKALNNELSHTYTYYTDNPARLEVKTGYSDSNWTDLVKIYTYYNDKNHRVKSIYNASGETLTTYYNDNNHRVKSIYSATTGIATGYYNNSNHRIQSKTFDSPDSQGMVYYHYKDENWKKQGYGRVDRSILEAPFMGELSYAYTYYNDSKGRLKTKSAFSDSSWTSRISTYTYYNDSSNYAESQTLISPDPHGNVYYHFINENWNERSFGRVDRSMMRDPVNGELSFAYTYYADNPARLQTKYAYSDSGRKTLAATYTYNNDEPNRAASKLEAATGITYTFYNDASSRVESMKNTPDADTVGTTGYFLNEDWHDRGYGRISKFAYDSGSYFTYAYHDTSEGRLRSIDAHIWSYDPPPSVMFLSTLYFSDDVANSIISRTDGNIGITYTYYDDYLIRTESSVDIFFDYPDIYTLTLYHLQEGASVNDWIGRVYRAEWAKDSDIVQSETYTYDDATKCPKQVLFSNGTTWTRESVTGSRLHRYTGTAFYRYSFDGTFYVSNPYGPPLLLTQIPVFVGSPQGNLDERRHVADGYEYQERVLDTNDSNNHLPSGIDPQKEMIKDKNG